MIEKFNLTLTGTIETSLYESQPSSLYPTRTIGKIELPGKMRVGVKKGHCSFSFWSYPPIHFSYPTPEVLKEVDKGRFELNTSFESIKITNRVDNSKGVWRGLNVKGHLEYVNLSQEFISFNIELPEGSKDLYIYAKWPQRYYPRAPLEMRSQSTILMLDEKSLKKFNLFWENL